MLDQKQPKNMEYFNFLCGNVRIDPRCTRGIKASIAVAEAAFNKKNFFFLPFNRT